MQINLSVVADDGKHLELQNASPITVPFAELRGSPLYERITTDLDRQAGMEDEERVLADLARRAGMDDEAEEVPPT